MKPVSSVKARFARVRGACIAAAIAACSHGENGGTTTAAVAKRPADSSAGDVAQYSLMTNSVGWLTDSNLVSLAAIVNEAPVHLARIESQQSSNQQAHDFAIEIIRDHAALQTAIDSLAAKRRLPSQHPAVAESMQAPYDSAVAMLTGVPAQQMESRFVTLETDVHTRTLTDFAALAGNATDPDLRAMFASRATAMEQRHLARAKLVAATIAQADSAKQAKGPTRKP